MEKEVIAPLLKITVGQQQSSEPSCCGGTPTNNADACCQLDEQKKAEGEAGCGCNTSTGATTEMGSCC